jgi:hypothetical protein
MLAWPRSPKEQGWADQNMSWRINGLPKVIHRVFSGWWNSPVSKIGNLGLAQLQSLPSFTLYDYIHTKMSDALWIPWRWEPTKKTYKMLQFWYIFPSFPIHFLSGSDSCGSHLDLGASMTIYYHGHTFTSHGAASCALPLATSNATCNWVSKQLRKKRSSQLQIVADSCSVLASIYIYTWIWIFRQNVSYSSV